LAQLQGVGAATKRLLDASSAWHDCISREMPELDIAPELLRPEVRRSSASHFGVLLNTNFAKGVAAQIWSTDEAERLAKLVKGAQRAASMHSCTGGGASSVVVAKLRFPREELEKAMEGDSQAEPSGMCRGTPISFAISEELAAALGAPSQALEVQFAWDQGSLLVRVQDLCAAEVARGPLGGKCHGASSCEPLVDVSARHPAFTLYHRGGTAELGGAWRPMGPGLASANMGKAAACRALAEGVLCTVCVREGRHKAAAEAPASSSKYLAHALHLDHLRPARPASGGQ